MILDIDPKVDYAFKRVYGRQENLDVLESILSAVLTGTEFETFSELQLVNPYNERDASNDKLSIVDVRARRKSGEIFNIDMQLLPFKLMPQRLLYYWSVSYSEQLEKGHTFAHLVPTIVICFADFDVFPGRPNWHSRFRVADAAGFPLCRDLEIHVLELPKFAANPQNVATPLEQWLFFLRTAATIDPQHVPPCLTLPTIHKAIEELRMISLNETDREAYRDRRMYLLDEQTRQWEAREEGLAKGRDEGFLMGRIQLYESLLGHSETPREQLEKRTLDELQKLEADLKRQMANRS